LVKAIYEIAMAIKANHVDPVVGGVVPTDDQAGQRAARKAGIGAAGAAADHNGRTACGERAGMDLR
jgi:hypothetical protein